MSNVEVHRKTELSVATYFLPIVY